MSTSKTQAIVFRRLRQRLLRNSFTVMLQDGRLRLLTMIGTSVFVALLVFGLAWFGFHELFQNKVPAKGIIVSGLFDLMFFTLGGMLIFSTGIILYASLYTAPEARYLLTTPAKADHIFATKFQAAIAFSSWAFMILGIPILISYGIVAGVPWYYYPLLPIFLLGFVLLPGSLSALLALLMVRYLPKNRKQALIFIGLILTGIVLFWLVKVGIAAKDSLATGKKNEVEGLIGQFDFARHPLMPSHWMTNGIMAAARQDFTNAAMPLAMLWSNGLVLFLTAAWVASRIYRTGFDRISGSGRGKKIYGASPLDRIMEALVFYLPRPMRILVVKDFRTFRRDPTQWVLLFIFGGLLLLGASNFRQYYRNDLALMDKYIISLVNLSGTAVLLCAGLSRFIFPLMSLEGRKFWILGLMPIRREDILLGKFAFAATGSVILAGTLILVSDILLGLNTICVLFHLITLICVALGLSALNVGLGAYMPNFRETDPSKIVVGFGGTVNMVVGLAFLALVIGSMIGPLHAAGLASGIRADDNGFPNWIYYGLPIGLTMTALAIALPLRMGARSLRTLEV